MSSNTKRDPWRDRVREMKCGTCIWFIVKQADTNRQAEATKQSSIIGRCRRHAPTMSGYPVVFADDWCGDHKLDEASI